MSATLIRSLRSLVRLEIDMAKSLQGAIERLRDHGVDDEVLLDEIHRMKADDERHVLELSEVIRAFGQVPPRYVRDLRGVVMSGFTAVSGMSGADGVLRAVRANSGMVADAYDRAIGGHLPIEVTAMLQANQADHRRHVVAIEQRLKVGLSG